MSTDTKTFQSFLDEVAKENGDFSWDFVKWQDGGKHKERLILTEAAQRFGDYMYNEGLKAAKSGKCYFVADDRKGSLLTTCINCGKEKWEHSQ